MSASTSKNTVVATAAGLLALLAGCKTAELSQPGRSVLLGLSPPVDMGYEKSQCQPLGVVIGKGGGSFGGAWISNEQLTEYAMNDLRNQAAKMGANVVHYSTPQMGTSGGQNGSNVSTANITGTAYRCMGRPGELSATVPVAQNTTPQVSVTKTTTGSKLMQLVLGFPDVSLSLAFTPEQADTVWWNVTGGSNAQNQQCEPMIMVDGAVRKYSYHSGNLPRLAFAMPLADFQSLVAAGRVVGRFCDTEWRLDGQTKVQIGEFDARIREEAAWGQGK